MKLKKSQIATIVEKELGEKEKRVKLRDISNSILAEELSRPAIQELISYSLQEEFIHKKDLRNHLSHGFMNDAQGTMIREHLLSELVDLVETERLIGPVAYGPWSNKSNKKIIAESPESTELLGFPKTDFTTSPHLTFRNPSAPDCNVPVKDMKDTGWSLAAGVPSVKEICADLGYFITQLPIRADDSFKKVIRVQHQSRELTYTPTISSLKLAFVFGPWLGEVGWRPNPADRFGMPHWARVHAHLTDFNLASLGLHGGEILTPYKQTIGKQDYYWFVILSGGYLVQSSSWIKQTDKEFPEAWPATSPHDFDSMRRYDKEGWGNLDIMWSQD